MKTAIIKLASGVFFITALISSVWAGEPLALYSFPLLFVENVLY